MSADSVQRAVEEVVQELRDALEVYTEGGGNELVPGSHVIQNDIVDGEILVELDNGFQFAVKVEAI